MTGVPTPRCPLCGSALVEIASKTICSSCGRIAEGCCEGEPQGTSRSRGRSAIAKKPAKKAT